jgi:ribosome recycling factor
MDLDHLLKETKERMQKALEHLRGELAGVRTGRANPSLLEEIKVDVYGTKMNLRDLASINAPEPRLLVVQIWDSNNLSLVEKAIRDSGLGFNPTTEGSLIRVAIPPLNEERRKEMIKLVNERTEGARVAIRQIRREIIEEINKLEKSKKISEDDRFRKDEEIQKITENFSSQVENIAESKETEILQV